YPRQAVVVDRYGVIDATQSLVAPDRDVIGALPSVIGSVRILGPDAGGGDRLRVSIGDDERFATRRPVRLDQGPAAEPVLVPVALEVPDLVPLGGRGDEFDSRLDLVPGAARVGHGLRQFVGKDEGGGIGRRERARSRAVPDKAVNDVVGLGVNPGI